MPRNLDPSHLRRTLVVNTAFLGDVVLTIPLVRALRRAGAERITVVTSPAGRQAMESVDEVHDVVVLDKRGVHRSIGATVRAGRALRDLEYSCAIVPHRSLRSALFTSAVRTPISIGFDTSAGRPLFSHTVRYHRALPETHRLMALLAPFHPDPNLIALPRFTVPAKHEALHPPRLLVAPGSQWGTKRWPPERFAEVVRMAAAVGWSVAITGSTEERPLCDRLRELSGIEATVQTGATFAEYRNAVAEADLVLANDTATVHVANLVGTPVVAIFGPTVPEMGFAPNGLYDRVIETRGLICRPCDPHGGHACPLGTHACMGDIAASTVFDALHDLFRTVYATQ